MRKKKSKHKKILKVLKIIFVFIILFQLMLILKMYSYKIPNLAIILHILASSFLIFMIFYYINKSRKKYDKEYKRFYFNLGIIMLFVFLGGSLNFVAMGSNGWRMPVKEMPDIPSSYSAAHFYFNDSSTVNQWFLSDIFPSVIGQYSIGDLIIVISCVFCVLYTIAFIITKKPWKQKKQRVKREM